MDFSRPLDVRRITVEGVKLTVTADQLERDTLKSQFDLISLSMLSAVVELNRSGSGGDIRVAMDWQAEAEQRCVVTLEPIAIKPTGQVELCFIEARENKGREDTELVIDPEMDDPPDTVIDGCIDLGVLLSEQFALALDPYPRCVGARFDGVEYSNEVVPAHPFAALAHLAEKK